MEKKIFEISVSNKNELWGKVFEHILTVLHQTLDEKPFLPFLKYKKPNFTFEIVKRNARIRFFMICEFDNYEFLKNQIYAHLPECEIEEKYDYLDNIDHSNFSFANIKQKQHYLYPIKNNSRFSEEWEVDPLSSITSALNNISNDKIWVFQVNFSPIWDSSWKKDYEFISRILLSSLPVFLKKIVLNDNKILQYSFLPFILFFKLFFILFSKREDDNLDAVKENTPNRSFEEKIVWPWYNANINIWTFGQDKMSSKVFLREVLNTLWIYSLPSNNSFELSSINDNFEDFKSRGFWKKMIFNTFELSSIVHMPTNYVKTPSINWLKARKMENPQEIPKIQDNKEIVPIWITDFRASNVEFWIKPSDRRRHTYIVWKTGMWKSTLLENMILHDIHNWKWIAVIDPHWDLAEAILAWIPKSRTNDVILFDPSDYKFPVSFNMLDNKDEELAPLVASGLLGIFKKLFWDSWWPRLEHILRNSILALLDVWNATLISIPLMLTNEAYRWKIVSKIKNPVVKKFWTDEFNKWDPKQQSEFSASVLNKVGQFLSNPAMRNILWQPKTAFSMRWAMDNKKIVIINLSKGKIWEDSSALLGSMFVSKIQIDAMSRADIAEKDREDFYLYVDEFQNFATDSFASILSEARKYKLNLIVANQYMDQMPETVRGAVFWNVGSIISFLVWYQDWAILKEIMWDWIEVDDLVNVWKYKTYNKILVDWVPSKVFSAKTFPPFKSDEDDSEDRSEKIRKVNREKYWRPKNIVESKINKMLKEMDDLKKKNDERVWKYKDKIKEEKRKKHEELLKQHAEHKTKRLQEEENSTEKKDSD